MAQTGESYGSSFTQVRLVLNFKGGQFIGQNIYQCYNNPFFNYTEIFWYIDFDTSVDRVCNLVDNI